MEGREERRSERREGKRMKRNKKKSGEAAVKQTVRVDLSKANKAEGAGETGITEKKKKEEFRMVTKKNKTKEGMRLEKLKERKPDKSFVVSVGEGGVAVAKKTL